MSQAPPVYARPGDLRPHRGVLILVLGILSLIIGCLGLVLGITAWVMANSDLREMNAGRMDPSGRGMTEAGRVLGIVSVALYVLGFVVALFWIVLVGGLAALGGMAGQP